MNQDQIRLAVMPITKYYGTDLLSLKLHRLQTGFYTDTLFPKVNQITGHECYQIYTDRVGLVWIVNLLSKSEVCISLRIFSKQVGMTNELHLTCTQKNGTEERLPVCVSGTLHTVQDLVTFLPQEESCQRCNFHRERKMEPQDSALEGAKNMMEFWLRMGIRYLFQDIV